VHSLNISAKLLRRLTIIALSALISIAFTVPASATTGHAQVLLFNGTGTIANDVKAVETILSSLGLSYATADSSQLDDMSESDLKAYKLLIVPGGDSITIGENLHSSATENVHTRLALVCIISESAQADFLAAIPTTTSQSHVGSLV